MVIKWLHRDHDPEPHHAFGLIQYAKRKLVSALKKFYGADDADVAALQESLERLEQKHIGSHGEPSASEAAEIEQAYLAAHPDEADDSGLYSDGY